MYCQQAVVEHAAEDVIEPLAGCFFRVEVVVRQIAPGEQQGIAAYGFAVCRLFWPVLIQVTRFRVRLFKKVPRQAEQMRQPAMRQSLECCEVAVGGAVLDERVECHGCVHKSRYSMTLMGAGRYTSTMNLPALLPELSRLISEAPSSPGFISSTASPLGFHSILARASTSARAFSLIPAPPSHDAFSIGRNALNIASPPERWVPCCSNRS